MKTKVFPLTNLVLYAKGWYKITDNVWDDLLKILKLDDYVPNDKSDILSIVINAFEKFDIQSSNLREVLFGISPTECWKVGYYVKGHKWVKDADKLPEYDLHTAIIYYVLSHLRFIDNEQWVVKTPKYSKYPKNPEIQTKRIIECFNKTNNHE